MRIVTFNNKGTGHVLKSQWRTLCNRRYPGALGEMRIEPYQDGHADDTDLHLCGKCQEIMESSVVVSVNELGRKTREPRLQAVLRHAYKRDLRRLYAVP